MTQNKAQAQALALDILSLARNTLLAELRFLDTALCRLELVDDPSVTLATDGQGLYYGFVYVLRRWRAEQTALIRSYLHIVLHCIYHHPFVEDSVAAPVWDLACDIAVEAGIDALDLASVACQRPPEAAETLSTLRKALNDQLTAERIYRYYAEKELSGAELEALRAPFFRDEHERWYQHAETEQEDHKAAKDEQSESRTGDAGGEKQDGSDGDERQDAGPERAAEEQRETGRPQADRSSRRREEAKAQWEQISNQVQTDLETHSRKWGDRAGGLLLSLKAANRKRLDYAGFLRQFAVVSEILRVDDDNFDYIFYTYGLQLYGNMPLVEPLEYREAKRVRNLVIVLDTSASVQGEKVRRFLEYTCQVLLETDAYDDARLELHIIECDATVQRDTVLTGREDLEKYVRDLQFSGGGGTDFRPAFSYIEELRRSGALPDLRGILYFTDGNGVYPARPPEGDCKTAFVFADAADTAAPVPPWAIRVLLDPDSFDRPRILILS